MNATSLAACSIALALLPLSACSARAPGSPSAPLPQGPAEAAPSPSRAAFDAGVTPVLAPEDAAQAFVFADAGILDEAEPSATDAAVASDTAPAASDAAAPLADAAIDGTASPDASPTAAIAVTGTVTDWNLVPLTQLPVTVLDAAGAIHETATDATGTFVTLNVVPPYLATVGQPTAGNAGMWSYVDVTTATPYFVGQPAPTIGPYAGVGFEVLVTVPSCGMPACDVSVNAVTPDGHRESLVRTGAPGATLSFEPGLPAAVGQSVAVTLDVLASDGVCDSYWYTQTTVTLTGVSDMWAAPVPSFGPLAPIAIPTLGQTTLASTSPAMPPSSSAPSCFPDARLSLSFADGSGFVTLAEVSSSTLSCNVPDILGATLMGLAGADCYDDPTQASGGGSAVFVTGLPLTTASIAATYPAISALLAPSVEGQAFSSSSVVSWQAVPSGLTQLTLHTQSNDRGLTVVTAGSSVSLAALAKTGVDLAPGSYRMQAYVSGPYASLDAALSPGVLAAAVDEGALPAWDTGSFLDVTLTP